MTIGTTSVSAGWYKDPAGSSAMRWWDGTQWTSHLQQPVLPAPPPAQQAPMAVADPADDYVPFRRDANYSNTGLTQAGPAYRAVAAVPVAHNSIGWFALVAGVVAIGAVFIRLFTPTLSFYLPVFGITASVASIRAISRYRRGTVSVIWAPIVGLVLGVTAEILLIASFVAPIALASGSATPVVLGPTGPYTNYDMGYGSPTYLPASNGMLSEAAQAETLVVATLKADYANGNTGAAADGSWPNQLTHTTAGEVDASDGRDLGNLIQPGWHLAYKVEGDGSYVLAITGPDTTEMALYDSRTDEYSAVCGSTDQTCTTSSPLQPIKSSGSSSAGVSGPA